jgi:hypothetical protein
MTAVLCVFAIALCTAARRVDAVVDARCRRDRSAVLHLSLVGRRRSRRRLRAVGYERPGVDMKFAPLAPLSALVLRR